MRELCKHASYDSIAALKAVRLVSDEVADAARAAWQERWAAWVLGSAVPFTPGRRSKIRGARLDRQIGDLILGDRSSLTIDGLSDGMRVWAERRAQQLGLTSDDTNTSDHHKSLTISKPPGWVLSWTPSHMAWSASTTSELYEFSFSTRCRQCDGRLKAHYRDDMERIWYYSCRCCGQCYNEYYGVL